MNRALQLRRRESLPSPRASGFFPAQRAEACPVAVVVVAVCAERALVRLGVNPAHYDAYDAGPVDPRNPLNCARYYRVRPTLPKASR